MKKSFSVVMAMVLLAITAWASQAGSPYCKFLPVGMSATAVADVSSPGWHNHVGYAQIARLDEYNLQVLAWGTNAVGGNGYLNIKVDNALNGVQIADGVIVRASRFWLGYRVTVEVYPRSGNSVSIDPPIR